MLKDALQTLEGWLSQAEVWIFGSDPSGGILADPMSLIAVLLGVLALLTVVSRLVFRWHDPRTSHGKPKGIQQR